MSENKQKLKGFIGGSYVDTNTRYDNSRTINYLTQQDEALTGKEQQVTELLQRPGLTLLQTVGPGPIRPGGLYTVSNSEVSIVVSGNQVYQITGALAIPTQIVGTLATTTGYVSISDNGTSVFIVDGTNGYYFDIGTFTLTTVVPGATATPNFYPSSQVTYQDGYFLFNYENTNKVFISDLESTAFLPSNYASKQGYPDNVVGLVSNAREVFIFGEQTTEVWYDQGASGSTPFVREDGKNSQIGCISEATIVQLAGTIFWLGQNPQGGAVVYFMNGYAPTRISTHAIEEALFQLGDLSSSYAYGIQFKGHYLYILQATGSSTTYVFDVPAISDSNPNNGLWTEFQSTYPSGQQGQFLGSAHCVLNGIHIIGDQTSGKIYSFDPNNSTDNNAMLLRMRQSPHISSNLNMMFYKLFQIDFKTGLGLVNNGTNSANSVTPQAILQYSDDGGLTFGTPIYAPMGQIGRYYTRARWHQLGSGRDRVFRLTITDPVPANIVVAMIDVERGTS